MDRQLFKAFVTSDVGVKQTQLIGKQSFENVLAPTL